MGQLIGYHAFYSKGKGFIVNNFGDVRREGPYLDWLLVDHAGDEFKKVCYDLDYFAGVLFRLIGLTREEAETLSAKGKLHIVPYDITYFPAKYLSVTKGTGWGRPYAGFFDMSQYMDAPSLDFKPSVKDCVAKAQEARDLGAEVSQLLHDLGLDGNALTSPIRSMEKSVLEGVDLPRHTDVPAEVNDLALRSCKGNWVEAFELGAWQEAYDLDISGAYASMLAELYDTRRGEWVRSPERPGNAVYGWAEVMLTIDALFTPVLYAANPEEEDAQRRRNYSPTGERPDVLNLQQMDFIRQYRQGDFSIDGDAWWWVPVGKLPYTTNQYQPLKGTVNWLYNKRRGKEGLEKKILKRCLAGLWGRTLSVRGKQYADSFFPVWGNMVETNTNLAVARLCLDNGVVPLHVAVDGVLTDKRLPITSSDELGSWRISHAGGCIIASSGIAAVEGKVGAEDFALNYDWLRGAMENDPGAKEYKMHKVGAYTLAKALNTNFGRLGEAEEMTRTITIGEESKRLYPEVPEIGGDLLKRHYKSEPMDISLIMTKEEIK